MPRHVEYPHLGGDFGDHCRLHGRTGQLKESAHDVNRGSLRVAPSNPRLNALRLAHVSSASADRPRSPGFSTLHAPGMQVALSQCASPVESKGHQGDQSGADEYGRGSVQLEPCVDRLA